jgi:hypothetical protein
VSRCGLSSSGSVQIPHGLQDPCFAYVIQTVKTGVLCTHPLESSGFVDKAVPLLLSAGRRSRGDYKLSTTDRSDDRSFDGINLSFGRSQSLLSQAFPSVGLQSRVTDRTKSGSYAIFVKSRYNNHGLLSIIQCPRGKRNYTY